MHHLLIWTLTIEIFKSVEFSIGAIFDPSSNLDADLALSSVGSQNNEGVNSGSYPHLNSYTPLTPSRSRYLSSNPSSLMNLGRGESTISHDWKCCYIDALS